MICYRDQTYCVSPDCKNDCGRQLTDEVKQNARKWWTAPTNPTGEGAPIAMSCFCGGDIHEVMQREA